MALVRTAQIGKSPMKKCGVLPWANTSHFHAVARLASRGTHPELTRYGQHERPSIIPHTCGLTHGDRNYNIRKLRDTLTISMAYAPNEFT